jgi:hypothetical protein
VIWSQWYPELGRCPWRRSGADAAGTERSRSGAFFSGGVDSFYMVLRDRNGTRPADVPRSTGSSS